MRPLVVFGILLIAIGVAGLLIDNISFTEKRVVVDAGPIKVTADQQRSIPIPSIAGVIAIIAGAGMIFISRRGVKA
jgi:nitrate reductase gamma subunit